MGEEVDMESGDYGRMLVEEASAFGKRCGCNDGTTSRPTDSRWCKYQTELPS